MPNLILLTLALMHCSATTSARGETKPTSEITVRVTVNGFRQNGLRAHDGVRHVGGRDGPLPTCHRRLLLVRVLGLAETPAPGGQERGGSGRLEREVVVVARFEAHAVHVAVVGVHAAAGKHPGKEKERSL